MCSCFRNKQWFQTVKPIWRIFGALLKGKVEGYDHRKPKKRAAKVKKNPLMRPHKKRRLQMLLNLIFKNIYKLFIFLIFLEQKNPTRRHPNPG